MMNSKLIAKCDLSQNLKVSKINPSAASKLVEGLNPNLLVPALVQAIEVKRLNAKKPKSN